MVVRLQFGQGLRGQVTSAPCGRNRGSSNPDSGSVAGAEVSLRSCTHSSGGTLAQMPKCDLSVVAGCQEEASREKWVEGTSPFRTKRPVSCGITLAMDTSPLHSGKKTQAPLLWGGGVKSYRVWEVLQPIGKYSLSCLLFWPPPLSDSRTILCPHGSPRPGWAMSDAPSLQPQGLVGRVGHVGM